MPDLTTIVLWSAIGLAGLVLVFILVLLGARAVRHLLARHLRRRIARVQRILDRHQRERFAKVDRLLFELGNIGDSEAVEAALSEVLESGDPAIRPRLRSVYETLGLTDRYIEQLTSASKWAVRAAAARALGLLGVAEAIPRLVATMREQHEDDEVKLAAARALSQMKADEAIPLLIAELADADDWASPRLAELLVGFGERAVPALQAALGDEAHTNARVWAAQILGRIGDRSATAALLARLQDRSERVRISVTEALGRLGDRTAVSELTQLALRDPVPTVRAEAARALGALGDASVIGELTLLLSADDYWTRLRAVEAIEKLRPDDTFPLEQALGDESRVVRGEAARALERLGVLDRWLEDLDSTDAETAHRAAERLITFGRAGSIESLLTCVESPSLRVRSRICDVLAEIRDPHATPALTRLLADPMWPVRARAAQAIGEMHPPGAAKLLLPLLSDDEEMVRVAAIGAIRRLGAPGLKEDLAAIGRLFREGNAEARCGVIDSVAHLPLEDVEELLREAIDDPNVEVRLHAIRQIEKRSPEPWVSQLTQRLTDADPRVRKAAAIALRDVADGRVAPALAECLGSADEELRGIVTGILARRGARAVLDLIGDPEELELRLALADALGQTGDPAALPRLRALAEDGEPAVRAAAAHALGGIADHASLAPLARLVSDPNESVRAAAVDALGRLGRPEALSALSALVDDPQSQVRQRVAVALGLVGSRAALGPLERLLERAESDEERAHVLIGAGISGTPRGREVALAALQDTSQRRRIESVLAALPEEIARRFRQRLAIEGEDPGEEITPEALRQRYIDQLRNSRDERVRLEALRSARALGVEAVAGAVIDVLSSDPSPLVRREAVFSLRPLLRDATVLRALQRALSDPIPAVQVAAVEALGEAADPAHNELLFRAGALADPSVGGAVESALVRANDGRVGDFLDELMGYDLPRVQAIGARVLGRIGDAAALRLLARWAEAGAPEVRLAAIEALGSLGTLDAVETIIDCVEDPREEIRAAAAEALAGLPLRASLQALRRLLKDPSVTVRSRLAEKLGESDELAGIELAADLCRDPAETVRITALLALLRNASPAAIERLGSLLAEQTEEIRKEIRRLARERELLGGLLDLVRNHRRPEARRAGLELLARLQLPQRDLVLAALGDPDPAVRIAAVELARVSEDREIGQALERLLDDPDPAVVEAVRKSKLSVVGGRGGRRRRR